MKPLWPWALISLVPVAVAAFWALRRPLHQLVPVSSLRLWRQALAALGPAAAKRSRRVSLAWLLLVAGAVCAGVGLSRPTWWAQVPARDIAVAIYPSAELAGLPGGVAEPVEALLERLDRHDRVRLILPTILGGAGEPLRADEAAESVRAVPLLPVPAAELSLPAGGDGVQHLYRFAPATLELKDGPRTTTIALPARPGDVTVDAFAVAPAAGGGTVEALVALRNHTADRRQGELLLCRQSDPPVKLAYDLQAGQREVLLPLPKLPGGGEYYRVTLLGPAGPGASAYVIPRSSSVRQIAMVGRDDPLIRRFVRAHRGLRLAGSLDEADAAIAVGAAAPPGKPALIVDPPAPPPPWRAAGPVGPLALRDADVLEGHPLLANVDLAAVAVRRAAGWQADAAPGQERLVSAGANALMLAEAGPPRVYLAFDLTAENTNFAVGESVSFVIFMANVMKYLLPEARPELSYESVTPLAAGSRPDWKQLPAAGDEGIDAEGPLPRPGIYRDESGRHHAVSLVGLRSAELKTPPAERIASLPLPAPVASAEAVELWPALLLAAILLWLAGWTARTR